MRFSGGWFKIHRKIAESDILTDLELAGVWLWLLSNATYKESCIKWGNEKRIIPAGTMLMNLTAEAKLLKWSRNKLTNKLTYLEKTDRIRTERGRNGTLVTICNWDKYQVLEIDGGPMRDRKGTDEGPMRDRKGTDEGPKGDRSCNHNEELKERKKERKEERKNNKVSREGSRGNPKKKKEVSEHIKALRKKTREVYFFCYRKVLGVDCPTNAKINSCLSRLVDYLGADAPNVAGYYFKYGQTKAGNFYGTAGFSIEYLVKDYQKIFTAYKQAVIKGTITKDFFMNITEGNR